MLYYVILHDTVQCSVIRYCIMLCHIEPAGDVARLLGQAPRAVRGVLGYSAEGGAAGGGCSGSG